MDHYKERQDVTEKMLLEELEAQSHNSDICESETDRSNNEDVPREIFRSRRMWPETDSDGDNVSASDDSDADSETNGGYQAKKWTNF